MGGFATTHWSLVCAAGDGDSPEAHAALECLCRSYWYPVHAFIRRLGHPPDDARDLTQEFFARLLARRGVGVADPARGRFRAFLLASVRHFLSDEWDKNRAQKRGGGASAIPFDELGTWERFAVVPSGDAPPDVVYERNWARSVLAQVSRRLREEYAKAGRIDRFEGLEQFLPDGDGELTYAQLGGRLGLTEAAIRSEVHRMRERFRELLRREIAHTVSTPEEIDGEIHHLMRVVIG